ncbi:MAG: hypothetical protein IJ218_04565 [Alphaproteobacteria bacterium]|nr:hypothetical protein [Alphaproteobacteria bacterium]
MKKRFLLCCGIFLFSAIADLARASICYLPEGCTDEENKYVSVSMCTQAGGYYKKLFAPTGYDCVSAESDCPGMVYCKPGPCMQKGFTYSGPKVDEDAWQYITCPEDSSMYKRVALPCEEGFSTSVRASNCALGFITSHKSGDYACGKCSDEPQDDGACEANNLFSVGHKEEGCQICYSKDITVDGKTVSCIECKDFSASYFSSAEIQYNGCIKNLGKAEDLSENGITVSCYKKTKISYKNATEAGCHKDNYDAINCTCTGEDDGCPDGYFKEVFGSCPGGSHLAKASDGSLCLSCVEEVCSDKVSTMSAGETAAPVALKASTRVVSMQTMSDDKTAAPVVLNKVTLVEETQPNISNGTKTVRSYVNKDGGICTEECLQNNANISGIIDTSCSSTCVSASYHMANVVSSNHPGSGSRSSSATGGNGLSGDGNRAGARGTTVIGSRSNCTIRSVLSGNAVVFGK